MIKDENIICISSIDWDFIWQGHQEIMSAFARNGNRVLYIDNTGIRPPTFTDLPRIRKRLANWLKSVRGFRKERENLYVYSPLILPFPYSRIARWINRYLMIRAIRWWMQVMHFDAPVVWTFLPTGIALDIIHSVNAKALIYYYIADFYRLTNDHQKLRRAEETLMRESDAIFVQGQYFKERCLKFNRNVFIFPFGVNTGVFENFKRANAHYLPEDLQGLTHPIIGYIGGLHRHVDFDLIREVAARHPEWSVVMVGPVQTSVSQIKSFKNVRILGKKDFAELPAYIGQFDVCTVPYLLSEYTRTVYPTKINEYHIMGKPVVSTALPDVVASDKEGLVSIAAGAQDFTEKIELALRNDSALAREARIRSAENNSWERRIEQMSANIEEVIRKKNRDIPLRWQERFIGLYRNSRKRIIRFSFAAAALWVIIFYTPLIWRLAEPLKFFQEPANVDAIVVFAGGVGETGVAGQGYEERVSYAVEIYKKGYAKNLVFSSGARSTFPEPYMMKALAVSLGVPAEAVLLDDKASNTYTNVKFTVEILSKKKWDEVILVSSPYHMLRSSLVFRKAAPYINVIYSPIPESRFYGRSGVDERGRRKWRQISLSQIKGIIKEYAAICYYWLKGYI